MCGSPAYFKKCGQPPTPRDLVHHNCLLFRPQTGGRLWRFARQGIVEEIEVRGNIQANNSEALHVLTTAGVGLGWLPTWIAGEDIQCGRLHALFAEYQVSARGNPTAIYAICPPAKYVSSKVRVFVDFLTERLTALRKFWKQDIDAPKDTIPPFLPPSKTPRKKKENNVTRKN